METDQYKIEWLLDTEEDFTEEERRELVEDLAQQLDAEDEIEYGGEMKRQSVTAFDVSVGILLVSSVKTLIDVYQFLQDDDESNVGIRQYNNQMLYAEEIDPETVENHGGDIIGHVEGDVYLFTNPEDFEKQQELKQELRESESEESDTEN
ncbi:hypothetical protein EXE51_05330 [Halorubrum sp. CGM5_25_10-8B]|uniref:hypothetical protein n=1 Tax=Halorubrum sp. CGM5_25_10-8B TaxID=2518115 RepID=UPI0010FA21F3|nr:hypothetical protein [Halorubrum sp. CGM5_25_10-8B]TKX38013.1 hypothetical protein EXE51_05330 [Halorubrum sp. CGM5_25_10-8B]